MKKLPKVLPYNECLELFSKAKTIRNKMLLEFLFYCGLRVSEAVGERLKLSKCCSAEPIVEKQKENNVRKPSITRCSKCNKKINLIKDFIRSKTEWHIHPLTLNSLDLKEGVLKVVQGKGGKDRLVPIPKPLMMDLKNWLALEPKKEDDILFPISRVRVHKIIKELNPEIHAHTLRHSYATYLYDKKGDIRMVQELLGHSNIGTTSIYTHLSTKMKRKTIDEVF